MRIEELKEERERLEKLSRAESKLAVIGKGIFLDPESDDFQRAVEVALSVGLTMSDSAPHVGRLRMFMAKVHQQYAEKMKQEGLDVEPVEYFYGTRPLPGGGYEEYDVDGVMRVRMGALEEEPAPFHIEGGRVRITSEGMVQGFGLGVAEDSYEAKVIRKAVKGYEDIEWMSGSVLPPVNCPLVLQVPVGGGWVAVLAERRNYATNKDAILKFYLEDGSALAGRYKWSYR